MKSVEIVLRETVPSLGLCGDVVKVSAGYARNYLLPKRLAISATQENILQLERRSAQARVEEAATQAEAEARAVALSELELRTSEKADEGGHLFGSVSASAIAALLAESGFEVDEKSVRMEHPIKELGTHTVSVHVRGDLSVGLTLLVERGGS